MRLATKKIKFNKIFPVIFHSCLVASLLAPSVSHASWISWQGGGVDTQSVFQDFAQQTESRYGFDQDVWRSAKRKVNAPKTEIFFDNTNPTPGEKVTAHAIPEFFKNDPKNLYYTWYIIHTEDGTPKTATNSVHDGMEEAAGILARGDYDPALDEQTYSDGSADPDKDGWPAVDANNYAKCAKNNKEKDHETCNFAPMGGSDGLGGLNDDLREKYSTAGDACRAEGDPAVANCDFFDQAADMPGTGYFSLRTTQANHWCQTCQECFSGASPTSCVDSDSDVENLPQSADLEERNQCCYTATPAAELPCVDPGTGETVKCDYNSSTDYCGATARDIFQSCYNNFRDDNKATVSACIDNKFNICKSDWTTSHTSNNEEVYKRVSRCYKHKFGVNYNPAPFGSDDSSGIDEPVSCTHKWQNATDFTSGSGKFSTNEEDFWKTDPRDPDTDGDGFQDEADVIGLGQDTFTWTYRAGDRVGVVVEGTSMLPTDEKNAYYKIMWGYLDVCDATKKDLMNNDECESDGDEGYGFLATKSPSEEFSEEKIKATLSYSPENPIADPTSEETLAEADRIDVLSSLDNTTLKPANLYYSWFVQKEDSASKSGWSGKLDIGDNFSNPSASDGIGFSSFSFTPKKDLFEGTSGDVLRVKVTLAVSRTAEATDLEKDTLDRETPRRGYTSVEIPINRSGVHISLHKVEIVSTEGGGSPKAGTGEEVCDEDVYKLMCPAVKGQLLAATVSGGKYNSGNAEFSWSLDGNPLNPPQNYSGLFKGWNSTTVFFPITKETQELESVSVTAIPKDKPQPVTGNRLITVVDPALFIKSSDENKSWPMKFMVADENSPISNIEQTSADAFEATAGTEVSYYLDFVPYYLLGNDGNTVIDWSVNGTSISDPDFQTNNPDVASVNQANAGQQLILTMPPILGSYTTIGAEVKKYWSEDERRISNATWGILPETLSGQSSITVAATPLPDEAVTGIARPRQILAAIGTNLPHYLMYNLRLALTLLVMFFLSAGFYALSQSLGLSKEK